MIVYLSQWEISDGNCIVLIINNEINSYYPIVNGKVSNDLYSILGYLTSKFNITIKKAPKNYLKNLLTVA